MTQQQRHEARERVTGPGAFEGCAPIAAIVHDITLEGFADDQANGADQHIARVGKHILFTDSQGAHYHARFASEYDAQGDFDAQVQAWSEIETLDDE